LISQLLAGDLITIYREDFMEFVFWVPISNNADIPKHQCMGGYDFIYQQTLSVEKYGTWS